MVTSRSGRPLDREAGLEPAPGLPVRVARTPPPRSDRARYDRMTVRGVVSKVAAISIAATVCAPSERGARGSACSDQAAIG